MVQMGVMWLLPKTVAAVWQPMCELCPGPVSWNLRDNKRFGPVVPPDLWDNLEPEY